MPISRLGYVNNGTKKEFPVISALPREMTMAEFALLSDEEKMGDIIVTDYPVNEESDYVEVVADGVKTNVTLLNELFALVDRSRTNQGSVLIRNGIFHYCIQAESSVVVFTSGYVDTSASGSLMVTATLQASNSKLEVCKLNGTYTNNSSSVPTIGSALRIYYNDAHTFDFNTKAENCIFDPTGTSLSSTNAEDAIKEVDGKIDGVELIKSAYSGKELVYSALPISSTELHLDLPACLGNPTSVSVTSIVEMGVGGKAYDHWTADANGTSIWITGGTVTLGRYSSVKATLTWS